MQPLQSKKSRAGSSPRGLSTKSLAWRERFVHRKPVHIALFVIAMLWLHPASLMAASITYVQGNYATSQTAQSSVIVSFPAAQTAGDLNVVAVGWNDSTAAVNTVSDKSGNTYTRAIGPTVTSGLSQSIYYAKNIVGAASGANVVTVTFSTAAQSPDIRILEYQGADPNNPVDVTTVGSGSGMTSSSGSATTSNPADLLFATNTVGSNGGRGHGSHRAVTTGAGPGFTGRMLTSPDGDIVEDEMVTATGSYNATASLSSWSPWIMQMVAFRAAPGVIASPTVSGVSPNSGLSTGGTAVTITGTNFAAGATVTFGSSAAANVAVVNSTTITATTPAGNVGAATVTVTVNGQSGSLSSGFTYTTGAPTVSGLSPNSGPTAGGTAVTITGTSFAGGATVTFGSTAATNIAVVNSTTITATTPAGNAGAVTVTVTVSGQSGSLTNGFTYATATSITYVQGNSAAPQSSQTSVAVTFSAAQTAGDLNVVVVGWNDGTATVSTVTDKTGNPYTLAVGPTVQSGTASQSIYYAKNIGAAGAGANTVTVAFSTAAKNPDIRALEYRGADPNNPVDVTAASSGSSSTSSSGSVATTTAADLLFGANLVQTTTSGPGSGFNQRLLTSPDGDIAEDEMMTSQGSYSAGAPLTASGPWIMQMVAFRASSGSIASPAVSSVSPNSGPTTGGTAVTITGANFTAGATVTFGGTAATNIAVVNSATITATTPAGNAGAVTVTVTIGGASGSLASGFTYTAGPTVTGVSPNSGPTTGGTAVTITGANFAAGATVTFGSTAATNVAVVNSTTITATTPAGSAGAVTITVTVSGRSGSLASGFTYTGAAPTVTSVSPNNGPTTGGTAVTITGSNFAAGATVTFGSTAATNVAVVNSTTITATTPAGSAGAVTVTVTVSGRSGSLSSGFTYTAATTVTSVSPNSGPTTGGTAVTITGTNFAAGATVTFGGTAAINVAVVNSTTITATTPAASAGAVTVMVTVSGRSGSLASGFTYTAGPTVTSVSPNSGPATGGTAVTITGANFAAGATVTFGSTAATNVAVANSTTITATTPAGSAGAVTVMVTVSGQSGSLSSGFTYTAGPTVTGISPNSGPTSGGTAVTITGTNFTAGATVTFGGSAAANIAVTNSTTITATTPAGSAGAVTVTVTVSGQSGSLNNGFTYGSATATPTLVQHISSGRDNTTGYSNPTYRFFLPNPTLPGNCLVLRFEHDSSLTPSSVKTDKGDTFLAGPSVNSGGHVLQSYYVAAATGSQVISLVTTGSLGSNIDGASGDLSEFYNTSCVADTSGSASSRSITLSPTTANDLIWQSGDDTSSFTPTINSMTAGSGYTMLHGNVSQGTFAQYRTGASTGSQAVSFQTSDGDSWQSVAIAFKSAVAGTAPPTSGIRIVNMYGEAFFDNSHTMNVPCSGNLLIGLWSGPVTNSSISSSPSGTWSAGATSINPSGQNTQVFYGQGMNCSSTLTMKPTYNGTSSGGVNFLILLDVAGASTSAHDVDQTNIGDQTSGSTLTTDTITPTTANGLIVDSTSWWGCTNISATPGLYAGIATDSGNSNVCAPSETAASTLNEDNGIAFYYNPSTSPVTFTYTSTGSVSGWASVASAFKSASSNSPNQLNENLKLGDELTRAAITGGMVVAPGPQSPAGSTALAAVTMFNPATGSRGDVCSPGGLASLSGENFTSQEGRNASSYPLPTRLAGVQVKVNGHAAPVLFASPSQVNFQCPQLPPGSPLEVTVETENGTSLRADSSSMAAAAPGIFTVGGTNQGVILITATNEVAMPHQEGLASRPARPDESLTIYATGLGNVVGSVPEGSQTPRDRQIPLEHKIRVVIGDVNVDAAFAGLAPGMAGVYQVNTWLPPNLPAAATIPLRLEVLLEDGTVVRSNTVTLTVDYK